MTVYVWSDIRERALHLFGGDSPHGQLEQEILDVFERQPALVADQVERIGLRFQQGQVRSPWAVLRKAVVEAAIGPDVSATDTTSRERAVAQAEQWLRAAGVMFDRWSEVEDELFGDRGRLRQWADDTGLHERMKRLWQSERPRGEQCEQEELERAAKFVDDRRRMAEAAKAKLAKLDEAQAAKKAAKEPEGAPA